MIYVNVRHQSKIFCILSLKILTKLYYYPCSEKKTGVLLINLVGLLKHTKAAAFLHLFYKMLVTERDLLTVNRKFVSSSLQIRKKKTCYVFFLSHDVILTPRYSQVLNITTNHCIFFQGIYVYLTIFQC